MVPVSQVGDEGASSSGSFKGCLVTEEAVQLLPTPIHPCERGCGESWCRLLLGFQLCCQGCACHQVVLHHVLEERLESGEDDRVAENASVQLVLRVSVGEQGERARKSFLADRASQEVGGRYRCGGEAGHGGEVLCQLGRRVLRCPVSRKARCWQEGWTGRAAQEAVL